MGLAHKADKANRDRKPKIVRLLPPLAFYEVPDALARYGLEENTVRLEVNFEGSDGSGYYILVVGDIDQRWKIYDIEKSGSYHKLPEHVALIHSVRAENIQNELLKRGLNPDQVDIKPCGPNANSAYFDVFGSRDLARKLMIQSYARNCLQKVGNIHCDVSDFISGDGRDDDEIPTPEYDDAKCFLNFAKSELPPEMLKAIIPPTRLKEFGLEPKAPSKSLWNQAKEIVVKAFRLANIPTRTLKAMDASRQTLDS